MIKPWPTLSSKRSGDYRIFTIRTDTKASPRTGNSHDFFIIESVDWVNVIAVTGQNELVMVEQFRHGSNTMELEIPGGMMDTAESSAIVTGGRELREETGYSGQDGQIIGEVFSNPAIMSNRTYTVLFRNCAAGHALEWDSSEELVTRLVPLSEVPRLVADGRIKHSLVVAALYHFHLWQRPSAA